MEQFIPRPVRHAKQEPPLQNFHQTGEFHIQYTRATKAVHYLSTAAANHMARWSRTGNRAVDVPHIQVVLDGGVQYAVHYQRVLRRLVDLELRIAISEDLVSDGVEMR